MAAPLEQQARARNAVKAALLKRLENLADATHPADVSNTVVVAVSGGADSLALASATYWVASRLGLQVVAAIVDHGLQVDSAKVAQRAKVQCQKVGIEQVKIAQVKVEAVAGGIEKAAREARYRALFEICQQHKAMALFLGHTLDDQAEQVLLGLARGAGARSLAGIPVERGLITRPFLGNPVLDLGGLWRIDTEVICAAEGLTVWQDPMNQQASDFLRVAARKEALPALEATLGEHIKKNLVRTAQLMADDADYLEQEAAAVFAQLLAAENAVTKTELRLNAYHLATLHKAIRTRVIKLACAKAVQEYGSAAQKTLLRRQILHIDALVTAYRGQSEVFIPGKIKVIRKKQQLIFAPGEPRRGSHRAPQQTATQ